MPNQSTAPDPGSQGEPTRIDAYADHSKEGDGDRFKTNTCNRLRYDISDAERLSDYLAALLTIATYNASNNYLDLARHQRSHVEFVSGLYLAAFKHLDYARTIKIYSPQNRQRFENVLAKLNTLRRDATESLSERSPDDHRKMPTNPVLTAVLQEWTVQTDSDRVAEARALI
jgi:hypothetical protein